MSDQNAVWPDGAREALWQLSGDRFEFDDVAILTALEPFVQQRIAAHQALELAQFKDFVRRSGDDEIALRAEVARLREDGERLDWLDKHRPNAMGGSRVSLFRPVTEMVQDRAIGYGPTYRAAIDAARSAPGGEG